MYYIEVNTDAGWKIVDKWKDKGFFDESFAQLFLDNSVNPTEYTMYRVMRHYV